LLVPDVFGKQTKCWHGLCSIELRTTHPELDPLHDKIH
jgi:hypothetical protein